MAVATAAAEADAVAAAGRLLCCLHNVAVARLFAARWLSIVEARKTSPPLLDLLERLPYLFEQEVLGRLAGAYTRPLFGST